MKCGLKTVLILITMCVLFKESIQDLPVHCLVAKIEGDWLIHMGDNYSDKDLKCGHKTPDQNLDHYDVDVEKVFKKKYEILVRLERPNKILSISDNNEEVGQWTMIYDEGFELMIHDQVFFAFSRYKKVGKFSPSNTDTEDTPGYKNVCEKTFIGWYHNKNTNENWGCYWAEKVDKRDLSRYSLKSVDYSNIFKLSHIPNEGYGNNTPINNLTNNFMKRQNGNGNGDIFSLMNELAEKPADNENSPSNMNNMNVNNYKKKQNSRSNSNKISQPKENGPIKSSEYSYMDFVKSLGWDTNSGSNANIPHLDIYFLDNQNEGQNDQGNFLEVESSTKFFQPDYAYINRVNNPKNKFMWKAKVYDDFVGKSYSQMRNLLGNVNFLKSFSNKEEESGESSYLELEINMSAKEENTVALKNAFQHLPDNFDWRDVDGANYDSPIRKQGECGSCYAIAAVSVVEARIRIKTNNRMKPVLSPSSVISCSRYNQGCAGGYPYLVGKFGKEFGFVEENCQPYSETDDKCYNYCYHQKKWGIKDYGYETYMKLTL